MPNFCINEHGLTINSTVLRASQPIARIHELLGKPDRVVGAPAPAGHRNNHIHFYDGLGITLNEHHYTYQIHAVTFIFDVGDAIHATKHKFVGGLSVFGAVVQPDDCEDVLSQCTIGFRCPLAGRWFAEIDNDKPSGTRYSVSLEFKGEKRAGSRRSRRRRIVTVDVGLAGDNWDTTYGPSNRRSV